MANLAMATDPADLRSAYGCFPTGVTAVCVLAEGAPDGIVASSFTAVSLRPPLVSFCVQRISTTWPRLAARPRLGVSVLADEQARTCRQIAAKTGDRFAGLDWEATGEGAVLLSGSAAWLDCSVERLVPAGDHELVLLRVHGIEVFPEVPPLVFHGSEFRRLVTT